ncbi:MAG: D-glycero-beta-D-manno-heptose-7-phosphate kinase [Deltaproteobacteria bacterium]|jgi:rfaE bifunctional protein kinase chain/domain|nr:D-glycero-beta-D-manno-heptose-7-phosphate kinase [Deltaproteobacteria bacterium]
MTQISGAENSTASGVGIMAETLASRLNDLHDVPVLVVGDVMLDEYLIGDAQRISPEAPVPVVLVGQERQLVGGAGNVARNIKALGGRPYLVGACGDGRNSARLKACLFEEQIEASLINLPGRPATTKTRVMARGQQVIRIDHEDSQALLSTETEQILAVLDEHWPTQRVVIVSDYCKGVINEQLLTGLAEIKKRHKNQVLLLVDPKIGNFHLYKDVDLLTPNAKETGEGAGLPVRDRQEIIKAGQEIFRKINCRQLLTTLGADGMALFQSREKILHIPTLAQQVFDVTGAGDTVIATAGLALAAGFNMLEACVLANYAAGIVVGKSGSATASSQELHNALLHMAEPDLGNW